MSFLLQKRFKFTNNPEDLSLAIAIEKERNSMEFPVTVVDEYRVKSLVIIATLQLEYFNHTQELANLDEAILSLRTATKLENIHGWLGRAGLMLSSALILRSNRTGNSGAELEEAEASALNVVNGSDMTLAARQGAAVDLSLINLLGGGNSETLESVGRSNIQVFSEIAPPPQPIQIRHSALSNKSEDMRKFRLTISELRT